MYADILRSTGSYLDEEAALFEKVITVREIGKNEFLLRKGEMTRSIYYLLNGAVQQYDIVADTDHNVAGHNVIDLHITGDWFLNYESLIAQRPSNVFIETFSDSKIIEISLDTVHYLTAKSLAFLQLNRILEGTFNRLQFFDHSMTPMEKYSTIVDNRPGLIQAFPLKVISSFLKITPETLSRVRKAASKGAIS
ncbi:cAMP-binding domain of CRP or a regulatory subunit of cAMP-dependent protein kinases [Dyadobacter soli]|uniref:cAMP-binding domain of CRP or a regulatory subunit of cAMP-dependent protein kinases n=1 Tax=Dyadobacter soli TaxID=659014 RepID=A0A1G7PWJ5_9BACT|nr:cyclic nucleotide-binding domain-containing protein [Dyadobacter soli]SDF90601.1 cAMP-binding domain of CRP or a regulatory subunit of cAMP-dependent protein kinases [Dyadobacter soli]